MCQCLLLQDDDATHEASQKNGMEKYIQILFTFALQNTLQRDRILWFFPPFFA